ncbi:MAG TPA: hypothetical protein VN842_01155 [Thermoplasmata archaeon]|nr:hypothetical protein [Thermoplasmata archaeon]
MLTASDLEINVLEFRQRSFQFDRLATLDGEEYAVFSRTETESESQFRPRLLHLHLVVPLAWVVLDEANDSLRVAQDGANAPPHLIETVVEVGAEPPQFREQGIEWSRISGPGGAHFYAPAERAARLFSPEGHAALGV